MNRPLPIDTDVCAPFERMRLQPTRRPARFSTNAAEFDGKCLEFVHKAWNPKRRS